MKVNTKSFVTMTQANQNFSKLPRVVDEYGAAIILKNNKPRYMLLDFDEFEMISDLRQKLVDGVFDNIMDTHSKTFEELAK